jgi:RNA polymerase sigma factor (TIGR02999 family)
VSILLAELKAGDKNALPRLVPLVYQQLRRLASLMLAAERPGHTLQATAIVHEAYLRLLGQDWADWQDRAHFIAVAARQMRRVLVDHARLHRAAKRAGTPAHLDLDQLGSFAGPAKLEEILAVDQALDRLRSLDSQQAEIAELRYFAGLTVEETAGVLGISPRTVKRDWAVASAWLRSQFSRGDPP